MDPNLTYPIVLNASINATLIQSPSNPFRDWMPSIMSIIVVIIGGFITYFSTTKIEEKKRQFEIKKAVYFDVLSTLTEIRRYWHDLHYAYHDSTPVPANIIYEKIKDLIEKFNFHEVQLRLCASEKANVISQKAMFEVRASFSMPLEDYKLKDNYEMFAHVILHDLINEMKEDLYPGKKSYKHWWQFWK